MNSFFDDDLLRPGQLGALHALKAHFLGGHKKTIAQVHLPTGYGKTLLMLLAKFAMADAGQTLVVCGTEVLREQLLKNFAAFLAEELTGGENIPYTAKVARAVVGLSGKSGSRKWGAVVTKVGVGESDMPVQGADVVVSLPQSLNSYAPKNSDGTPTISLILIDEGHHVPAKTWAEIVKRNPDAKVVVFTATPFRRDGLPLPGRLVFTYTLDDAIEEGSITDATIHVLEDQSDEEFDPDAKLATKALDTLRKCKEEFQQAKLLVKCNDINRSETLTELYSQLLSVEHAYRPPLVLHSKLRPHEIKSRLTQLDNGDFDVVVAVEMLSEGLDNPDIRVLVVHDNLPDLGHFIQVAGRVSRTLIGGGAGDAGVVSPSMSALESHVILFKGHLPEAVRDNVLPNKLSDFSSAVSGRIYDEELRTWLHEHLEEGEISAETVQSIFKHAQLREYARVYELPSAGTLDWSGQIGMATGMNLVGYSSLNLSAGRAQVGLIVAKKPNAWLGALDIPVTIPGMVLTYEPKAEAGRKRLLFVTATPDHRNSIDKLVEFLQRGKSKILPLGLPALKSLYNNHQRVTYFNLGLRSRLRSPLVERYRIIAGTEIELSLSSDVAHGFSQGHVIGRMYDTDADGSTIGVSEILGISARSTVWGSGTRAADKLCEVWMDCLAKRIWEQTTALRSALENVPTADNIDLSVLPVGAGSVGFWGYKTIINGVTLHAEDGANLSWNDVDLSQAYIDEILVGVASSNVDFKIKFTPAANNPIPPAIEVTFDPSSQSFEVKTSIGLRSAPDEVTSLASWLRKDPPGLFLNDGSCLQGRDLIASPSAGSNLDFIRNSLFTMNWSGCAFGEEKPPGFEVDKAKKTDPKAAPQKKITDYDPRALKDKSIFTFVANELIKRVEGGELVAAFCDDDSYEVADFIAIRGDLRKVVVELYLCKRSLNPEPGLRTLEVAELWAQALRASQLLTKESLLYHFKNRGMARMKMAPKLDVAKKLVEELLESAQLIEFEIILVQPGLALEKLTSEKSKAVDKKNTIAHAVALLAATFQGRGVSLLVVGRTGTPKRPMSAPNAAKRSSKLTASATPTFRNIFDRMA